ncbi:MAG: metal ABC transporter permease [Verrucomicrobiota bacterium]
MMEMLHYDFMRYALISAALLGPMCAFLGVFITLRGMSFFSDAISHASLTGIAIGFFLQDYWGFPKDLFWIVLVFNAALSMVMAYFFQRTPLSPDTIIAFSFTGSVALGVMVISRLGKYRLLDGLLFGDIYSNGPIDIVYQVILTVLVIGFIAWNMKGLSLMVLDSDLAKSQGYRLEGLNYAFSLLIAATVAVAIKMLGTLLLSALIVIPPAAGKMIARSFKQMLLISSAIGFLGSLLGVVISYQMDTPTGPTIVLVQLFCLIAASFWRRFR